MCEKSPHGTWYLTFRGYLACMAYLTYLTYYGYVYSCPDVASTYHGRCLVMYVKPKGYVSPQKLGTGNAKMKFLGNSKDFQV